MQILCYKNAIIKNLRCICDKDNKDKLRNACLVIEILAANLWDWTSGI